MLATSVAAGAADQPIRPYYKSVPSSVIAYYNWTGYYVGLNIGYGTGSSDWTSPALGISPKGMMFGATLGANWQAGAFVYGLEGDFALSSMKGDVTCGAFTCETKNSWLGTARGRIGYAFDRLLPYVTAGAAFGDIKASTTNPAFTGANSTRFGWTAGAGIEYAFLGNVSAKVEYLFVDLGSFDCGTSCGPATSNQVSFSTNVIRFGVNYKFSGPIFSRW